MIYYGFVMALVMWFLAVCLMVIYWREVQRLRLRIKALEVAELKARAEAMAAEARSRRVGGTGTHKPPQILPVFPLSGSWGSVDDPRTAIPSDRAGA